MVYPQAMQDGRLQIVHMYRIPGDIVRVVVRLAIAHSRLDTASRHPDREAAAMVVPPVVGGGQTSLTINRPAKLAAPNHQGVLQHAPLLQVLNQASRCLIHILAPLRQICRQSAMVIPIAVVELNKPNTTLRQTPGQQAIRRKRTGLLRIIAVELEGTGGFFRDIGQFGHRRLHPESHLILSHPGSGFGVAKLLAGHPVQFPQRVQVGPAVLCAEPGRIRQEQNRIARRPELHTLILARQERRTPKPVVQRLAPAVGRDHDGERRQVIGFTTEAIGRPSPHARTPA